MDETEPELLEHAINALQDRAEHGIVTWRRLNDFIRRRTESEAQYSRGLSECLAVWADPKQKSFFGGDDDPTTSAATAGQVGSLREALTVTVDIDARRQLELALQRSGDLQDLSGGVAVAINGHERAVSALVDRGQSMLAELAELLQAVNKSRDEYHIREVEREEADRALVATGTVDEHGFLTEAPSTPSGNIDGLGTARSELADPRGYRRAQERLAQRMRQAEGRAEAELGNYQALLAVTNRMLQTLHTVELPALVAEFETKERSRLERMSTALRQYARVHRPAATSGEGLRQHPIALSPRFDHSSVDFCSRRDAMVHGGICRCGYPAATADGRKCRNDPGTAARGSEGSLARRGCRG